MIVWQKGIELIKEVYQITDSFPNEEKFGLVSQMRRAAVSVVLIFLRVKHERRPKKKRRFYEISRASLVEIDAQIEIALALSFITEKQTEKISELLNKCFAMLPKLKKSR